MAEGTLNVYGELCGLSDVGLPKHCRASSCAARSRRAAHQGSSF